MLMIIRRAKATRPQGLKEEDYCESTTKPATLFHLIDQKFIIISLKIFSMAENRFKSSGY